MLMTPIEQFRQAHTRRFDALIDSLIYDTKYQYAIATSTSHSIAIISLIQLYSTADDMAANIIDCQPENRDISGVI
jgi:hypothetical protein